MTGVPARAEVPAQKSHVIAEELPPSQAGCETPARTLVIGQAPEYPGFFQAEERFDLVQAPRQQGRTDEGMMENEGRPGTRDIMPGLQCEQFRGTYPELGLGQRLEADVDERRSIHHQLVDDQEFREFSVGREIEYENSRVKQQ